MTILSRQQKGDTSEARFTAIRALLGGLAVAVALIPFVTAGSAFASGVSSFGSSLTAPALVAVPPQIEGELSDEHVFATRAHIAVVVPTQEVPAAWEGEIATSPGGPWTVVGSGSIGSHTEEGGQYGFVALGTIDGTSEGGPRFAVIHHLTPATAYYVRFKVTNEAGSAERAFEFTTLPVGKPEIAQDHNSNPSTFTDREVMGKPTQTMHSFKAQVESDGAETKYFF